MTNAFNKDAEMHMGEGKKCGPPGYDNGEFITKWGLESESESYTVYYNDEIIGAFILWIADDNNNFLGNIFIDPKYDSKGIGTSVWKLIENKYQDTKKWTTETPGFSRRNHSFYVNKCGFKIVKIEAAYDFFEANYIMEKEMK
ncbi:GNAT family N-acetyltransferase [Clostridium sp. CF011]|uniref:GNAT family N-acetyltransferase n=1 Tax=Clostridium sp. CF011 TaxID=2843318 RepID=UPI001C0CA857|nr:GNAT family N-acetyltransferase [Clostridium sp. CF011]MBU3093843.1 GNAT family N-acetyltransferase [Clostridium sp. CF011]WAG71764.1 GNAT family N-acetyltransferase [Clostridium sp. CF011]